MIITIDGPAGAGKSTVSKMLAKRLGYVYLDTGSLYRALAYKALKDKIVLDPYCGSGTVALAAKLFQCRWCGIDISQNYIDMAEERLKNSNDYLEIYQNEIDKHVIKGITYQERKKRKQDKLDKQNEQME